MAPIGSWESLQAAIDAKADSVYLGVGHLNMRAHSAAQFSFEEMKEIVEIAHRHKIRAYATLNAVVYDDEIPLVQQWLEQMQRAGIDAIIASDWAVIQGAHVRDIPVHISTQLNVANIDAVRLFARYSSRMVLARELTLEQIGAIARAIDREKICGPDGRRVEIELFIHGALCISISGKCSMSLALYNQSANRGLCTQPCRRKYRVIDEETEQELLIDNHYVMSPKDLCTLPLLDQILAAGVSVLKIEGRGRSPEYVRTVVSVYREAVDAIQAGLELKKDEWMKRLRSVYHRGFWEGGYYLGKKGDEWSGSAGSQATQKKKYLGKITNYFTQQGVAECTLTRGSSLREGDEVLIFGKNTGVAFQKIASLQEHEGGAVVTFGVDQKVRRNDQLYLVIKEE